MNSVGNVSFCGNKRNYKILDKAGFEVPLNTRAKHKTKVAEADQILQQALDEAHFNSTMHNPAVPAEKKAVIAGNRSVIKFFTEKLKLFK